MQDPIAHGKAHFMETLGNVPEPIRALIDHAPGYFEGYIKMREHIYREGDGTGLDLKTKELIYVVLDIVGGNYEGAENHLQAGMKAGLTAAEVADACVQIIHAFGVMPWGKGGYRVCDTALRIEKEMRAKAGG
jgi:alkylhydroperoxidase/carboxymuconolactone decarboxylase family protein YurZ